MISLEGNITIDSFFQTRNYKTTFKLHLIEGTENVKDKNDNKGDKFGEQQCYILPFSNKELQATFKLHLKDEG